MGDLLVVVHRVAWCSGALLQLSAQSFAFEQGQSLGKFGGQNLDECFAVEPPY